MARQAAPAIDYPLFIGDGPRINLENGPADESMRVTYEDPGERDEKLRLLGLLNKEPAAQTTPSPDTSQPKKARNLVRRVTRAPGF